MSELNPALEAEREILETEQLAVVPVGVSGRHVHLCDEDMEILFGAGHQLEKVRNLRQPGEFAARETLTVAGPQGVLERVRVLGPLRSQTQIEISLTDAFKLGLRPPVRNSGSLDGTPGATLIGPEGTLVLEKGVILAARHIHMNSDDADRFGYRDGQRVRVRFTGTRGLILENVLLRVKPTYALELHIDTDEANAGLLSDGSKVQILH